MLPSIGRASSLLRRGLSADARSKVNKLASTAKSSSKRFSQSRYCQTTRGLSTSASSSRVNGPTWWLAGATMGGILSAGAWFSSRDSTDSENKPVFPNDVLATCLTQAGILPIVEADITFAPDVPAPITRNFPVQLRVNMNTEVRKLKIDESHEYEMWTFNGGVPGPFIRARVGDVLDISFTNQDQTGMWHNLDFHCISGPGGGAPVLTCAKDETRSGEFKLLYPGLFLYHCAIDPVATHMANGMYGAILVEPEGGLPRVDREYYVVQSELYCNDEPDDPKNEPDLLSLNEEKLNMEHPSHVVFNGRKGAHTKEGGDPLTANTGERVRLFVVNAGPNLISSFHVIGGIFDKVYREADLITHPARGLQTTLIPAGGASVVELVPPVPGTLTLVDHAITRIDKGAVAFLQVEGPQCSNIYHSDHEPRICKNCKIHP